MQDANDLRFDVRHAIKRIHQQAPRSFIHRQGHRVDREITPPQIFNNRGWRHHGRFSLLLIALGPCHRNLGAHAARQRQQQGLRFRIRVADNRASAFEIFL